MLALRLRAPHCAVSRHCRSLGSACPQRPCYVTWRAFADDVPGMASGNCVTDATTRELIRDVGSTGGDGGDGGGSGGGGAGGSGGSGSSSAGGGAGDSQPHPMRNATFAFAVLLAAGGIMAFVRKGSVKSFGASAGAAFILALCARAMVGSAASGPARVAFALCTLLGIAMATRFNNSRKFFPAGLVALTSLGMAAGFVGVGL